MRTNTSGPSKSAIQNSSYTYAADAQVSDAYAITLSPAPASYSAGQVFLFKANTANTGAASLNVNSLGAITLKKLHDQDLATGDIEVGSIIEVVYDGTNFQIVSVSAVTPGDVVSGGIAGGQTVNGGTAASETLLFKSTSHATKGKIGLGSLTTGVIYDEVNNRLSIGSDENAITISGVAYGETLSIHAEGVTDAAESTVHRHSDTAAFGAHHILARSRGTEAAETVVQNGDYLGRIDFIGHDGTDYEIGAQIDAIVDGVPGAGDMPTRLSFLVTPDGSATPAEAFRISSNKTSKFYATAYFAEFDNGNSSTADTIDWNVGNKQKSTLTGNCTFTFTAPPGPCSLILKLIQDATGSRTVTWPATVHWSGGTAPTLTTTANKVDLISLYFDGTTYFGTSSLNYTA